MIPGVAILAACTATTPADDVTGEIERYIGTTDAWIGVAVITDRGDTISVNNDEVFEMNSVMKLYQAIAVMGAMERDGTDPDTVLHVERNTLEPRTYTPMLEVYADGDFDIAASEVMRYSLQESDNNACDILFDHFISPHQADTYLKSAGIEGFTIGADERLIFADHALSADNLTYPLTAAEVIDRLFTGGLLGEPYQTKLTEMLTGCRTGMNHIAGGLPGKGVTIGHKTGTGFPAADGMPSGINDVAYVALPDGGSYSIAVFVGESDRDMAATEQLIADISEIVYRWYTGER